MITIAMSCTKKPDTPLDQLDTQSNNPLFGSWEVVFYEDLEHDSITSKDDVDSWGGMDVQIKFMDDSTFCGGNTTNDIAGHYTITDSSFDIDVYGGTKVGQPVWGNIFSDIVYSHSFTDFKRSDTELKLFYNDNKNCIVLFQLDTEITCRRSYSNE